MTIRSRNVGNLALKTIDIGNEQITAAKLAGDVSSLTGVDDVTIQNVEQTLSVKDAGIDTTQIADEAVSLAKLAADVVAVLDLLTDLPTENVASPAIWNDAGVLKVGSA